MVYGLQKGYFTRIVKNYNAQKIINKKAYIGFHRGERHNSKG